MSEEKVLIIFFVLWYIEFRNKQNLKVVFILCRIIILVFLM